MPTAVLQRCFCPGPRARHSMKRTMLQPVEGACKRLVEAWIMAARPTIKAWLVRLLTMRSKQERSLTIITNKINHDGWIMTSQRSNNENS